MPLTLECVQAMAAVAYIRKRLEMAQALLLGLAVLLRAGELLYATLGHLNFLKDDFMILTLLDPKGASRTWQPESVAFKDKALTSQIETRGLAEGNDALLCGGTCGSFTSEYKDLGRFLGVRSDALTPHGLRRGGVTWHFSLFFMMKERRVMGDGRTSGRPVNT